MGEIYIYLGVKQPGREADHSPPSSAEVKSVDVPTLIRLHCVVLNQWARAVLSLSLLRES
jgi:hypothetical protein